MKIIEGRSSSIISNILSRKNIDLRSIFHRLLNREINTLAILPCCDYLLDNLSVFQNSFAKVVLCDNYKKGKVLNGTRIVDQDELGQLIPSIDAYFISTSNPSVRRIFRDTVPFDKTVFFEEFSKELIFTKTSFNKIESVLKRIRRTKNPFIILGTIYFNNYTPIYKALEDKGYSIFILNSPFNIMHPSAHITKTTINEIAPFGDKNINQQRKQ